MELHTFRIVTNLLLLALVTGLFVFIRWYFSTLSSNIKNRMQPHEIALNIFTGFVVCYVITNREMELVNRSLFFLASVGIHIGACYLVVKTYTRKSNMFPKSYLVFHNGKFLKGTILQNKLTEEDIKKTLRIKGVSDLTEVDTIILEADGELTVIYKNKVKSAA